KCPFCSGLLRSRSFPKIMRRSRTAPLVETEAEYCCSGILTAMPVELSWWQSITFGTTAWRISMARRQVVESANSALKGAFADLSRGFFRVMGLVKTTVLLGFTLAAYNLDRILRQRPNTVWITLARSSRGRGSSVPAGDPAHGPTSSRAAPLPHPRSSAELHNQPGWPLSRLQRAWKQVGRRRRRLWEPKSRRARISQRSNGCSTGEG